VTAAERFKALYADAVERVCVLEEKLETARARISELEAVDSDRDAAAESA
jgi:hypothetical protein